MSARCVGPCVVERTDGRAPGLVAITDMPAPSRDGRSGLFVRLGDHRVVEVVYRSEVGRDAAMARVREDAGGADVVACADWNAAELARFTAGTVRGYRTCCFTRS